MRFYLLFLLLFLPCYAFSIDEIQETTILLKHRLAKDIIPYLMPHLSEDGRISGEEKNVTIRSKKSNINELLVIIGDLDRSDYTQLIISITMNMQAVHNINTKSIQVGTNTWTKINYGITYSKRVRETLPNGHLVEKIKYVKVIEDFQVHTKIDNTNKNLTLILRPTKEDSNNNETELSINEVENNELSDNDLQIKINGKMNKWISLANAVNSLYISSDEDPKIIKERKLLISKLGIKVQLLQ